MGWRESYAALVELFPQVDARLIKGAALEHGADVGAAAEYIINEIIAPDDESAGERQQDTVRDPSPALEQGSASPGENSKTVGFLDSQPYLRLYTSDSLECGWSDDTGNVIASSVSSNNVNHQEHEVLSDDASMASSDAGPGPLTVQISELEQAKPGDSSELCVEKVFAVEEVAASVERYVMNGNCPLIVPIDQSDARTGAVQGLDADVELLKRVPDLYPIICVEGGDVSTSVQKHAGEKVASESDGGDHLKAAVDGYQALQVVPEITSLLCRSVDSQLFESGLIEEGLKTVDTPELVGTDEALGDVGQELDLINEEAFSVEGSQWPGYDQSVAGNLSTLFDSVMVSPHAFGNGSVGEVSNFDTMLSVVSVDGMDGLDWESIHSSSVHLARMETLDDLVEQAKSDKELLINSIEEIRALRCKIDQAESSARQSKEEAARGGLEVLSRVEEMRIMLDRAREANAVHAGEVYGEKAVLATEARELRARLVQVKAEKAKALCALNEIKASLQARIDIAMQERDAAEQEKAQKETLAREILAREEELVAKVAQESRDLDAEVEACTKLREFLIERGSVVDALQGEVAVLCEDADALKKDLDGLSLSCSGGFVHMLSRSFSETFTSTILKSSKVAELSEESSEPLLDSAANSALAESESVVEQNDQKVPVVLKVANEKKSRSSLPSLLRALSSSQDLSSSSLSAHSSSATSVTSNSPNSSRNAARESSSYFNQCVDAEEVIVDVKEITLLSPSDVAPLHGDDSDVQMAMFPGEEVELEYTGGQNLDIFRSPKADGGSVDDEDWQLLDPVSSSKAGSRSSSSSDDGK